MSAVPASSPDGATPAEPTRAGWPEVAAFRWLRDEPTMLWSPATFRLLGYEPGDAQPSPELLLQRTHPDDRPHVGALLREVAAGGRRAASEHRVVRPDGSVRQVLLTLEPPGPAVDALAGVYTDLSGFRRTGRNPWEEQIAGLETALASRDLIGQAKGILMERQRVTADEAFAVLTRATQQTHLKLRDVAAHITLTGTTPPGATGL